MLRSALLAVGGATFDVEGKQPAGGDLPADRIDAGSFVCHVGVGGGVCLFGAVRHVRGALEIERELAEIGAENRAFSVHIAKEIKESPRPKTITVPEFDDDSASAGHSKMEVAAFLDGQPLALETKPPMRPGMPGIPPWLKDSFRGVVMGHGTCFLRAADTQIVDGHKLILVTSLPLEKENLDEIASGLGTVTLVPGLGPEEDEVDASQLDKGIVKQLGSQSHEKGGPPPPPPARFRVGRVNPTPGQGPVHLQINGRNVADMPGHPGRSQAVNWRRRRIFSTLQYRSSLRCKRCFGGRGRRMRL